jgi:hypothetical protein
MDNYREKELEILTKKKDIILAKPESATKRESLRVNQERRAKMQKFWIQAMSIDDLLDV